MKSADNITTASSSPLIHANAPSESQQRLEKVASSRNRVNEEKW